ncbi:hypothetical protein QSV34_05525 [Porticoccus sp. W117]|uniref:hypothetical protein n=1 Tax=Porticoccus sp. W117 TaxID=3054777 RepID=UPI00259229EA|nr:hypothetical protein [Porticoccus sp. W117]MDM3870810.1 hypothetical protein [Porticoccus sp. W117]
MTKAALLTTLLAVTAGVACADNDINAPCDSPEYRQFDFWLGHWQVFDSDSGDTVGENRIERIHSGCALQESWTGAKTSRGSSFNIYDKNSGQWHQSWVDNSGLLLRLNGGLDAEGRMVLSGPGVNAEGAAITHRITWIPGDNQVRQQWHVSEDGGESWKAVFDGTYKRKK